ncbi:hypothetical protein SAY86_025163 [Trapa natans]|uniref:Uncharacterized protein n=1 Tax=Trapa natans TaxID=22666 RepID=A0AAN7M099_TRANT|nr:hypothetical protein SAY86_025163 [Trapa natans]
MAKYWRTERNHRREDQEEEEEEEEEALSLSDLPINMAKTEETALLRREPDHEEGGSGNHCKENEKEEPEFDFGWWGNNSRTFRSPEPEMCAADQLFFKGQILPLRLSVSSDNGLVCRSTSRSESLDRGSVSRFIGSRSSSIRSYHSLSSSSTNSSSTATARADDHRKLMYRGHANTLPHPSPKPKPLSTSSGGQYRQSSLRSTTTSQNKFSLWDFFRTGLVRGPDVHIDLRDLRVRNSATSRASDVKIGTGSIKSPGPISRFSRNINVIGNLLGGASCKCSVETVILNAPATARKSNAEERLRKRSKTKAKERMKVTSRQRTSQWLKELSHSHGKPS